MAGILLLAIAAPALPEPDWQSGTIQAIEDHANGRIVFWENKGTLPIYDGYPYYDIAIQLGNTEYVVRYEGLGDYFPSAWQVGKSVKVRLADHRMYLVEYGASQVPARILQKYSASH